MNGSQSIEVLEDSSVPGGGYAVIRVHGVRTRPNDLSFYIRRIGYDQANLGSNGWQGPEERLEAFDSAFQPGTLDLMIGPEVVDSIDVGTAIEMELPGLGLQETLYWPDITPSVMGGIGGGRRVAFTERQAAPAPRPQAPQPRIPEDEPDADATMIGGRATPPPPPPPPEEEQTVILGNDDGAGFAEPDDRFDFGSDEEDEPRDGAGQDGRAEKKKRSGLPVSPALLAAGIVALLLVLGGLGYFLLGDGTPGPQVAEEEGTEAPPAPPPEQEPERRPPPEEPGPEEAAVTPPPPPPELTPPDTATRERPPEPPTEIAMQRQPRQPQTPPTTFVRSIVRADPAAAELYDLAQYHLNEGDVDVALLLLEQAELQGHGPAMTAIGRMYDPVHFSPSRSAFTHANAERAIQYYQEARAAGDPAAGEAMAELRDWLEVQAADGEPSAEELLRTYWQNR